MKSTPSKEPKEKGWPRIVTVGRVSVKVYKRIRAGGTVGYEIANYASGKRKLESKATEEEAIHRARDLARQMSLGDVVAAKMTNHEASDYGSAMTSLAPFNVALPVVASTVADCLKLVGDLSNLLAAAKAFQKRSRKVQPKRVKEAVAEFLRDREADASPRYLGDLRSRLNRFAEAFKKNTGDVTTAEISEWLNGEKRAAQTYNNFARVIHTFFAFAVEKGYAEENPATHLKSRDTRDTTPDIFTPDQIRQLLQQASPEFIPALAISAFAGLRSAEIERLEWKDVNFPKRFIVVTAEKAKTASRRTVPISENLAAWLAPYGNRTGKVWQGDSDKYLYRAQETTAKAAGIDWKHNALRHSFASYRFALLNQDAGRVAGELGNSPAMVHKHYKELVASDDATRWFAIVPESTQAAILSIPAQEAA